MGVRLCREMMRYPLAIRPVTPNEIQRVRLLGKVEVGIFAILQLFVPVLHFSQLILIPFSERRRFHGSPSANVCSSAAACCQRNTPIVRIAESNPLILPRFFRPQAFFRTAAFLIGRSPVHCMTNQIDDGEAISQSLNLIISDVAQRLGNYEIERF